MPRGTPSWTSNVDRVLIGFCCQLGPRGCQKSVFFLRKKCVFSKKPPFEDSIDFGVDFGTKILPKIHKNPFKHRFPKPSNFWSIFSSIFTPFWLQLRTLLGPKLDPSWLWKSTKSHPKRLPRRIWEPEPAQTPKMTPKWSPRPPKMMPQTLHFGSILVLILVIFKWLIHCDLFFNLGSYWCRFQVKRGGGYAALLRVG